MVWYEALRTPMTLWYAYHLAQGSEIPRPRGSTAVRIGPAGGRRVLLFGNGPCHGWGVRDHGLALAGNLAGELARRSRVGTEVDYVGDEIMNIASARSWLSAATSDSHDAAVVVIGVNDAVRLTPLAKWRQNLGRLLEDVRHALGADAPILVSGIQPPGTVSVYGGPLGRIANRHAERLNEVTEEVVGQHLGVHFMRLDGPEGHLSRIIGSPKMYNAWAMSIASELLVALAGLKDTRAGFDVRDYVSDDAAAVLALRDRIVQSLAGEADALAAAQAHFAEEDAVLLRQEILPVELDEEAWSGLGEVVRRAAASELGVFTALSGEARKRFGVSIATVTLVDGKKARYVGGEGGNMPTSVPLELTHCSHVVATDDVLVVPNSPRDPRFADNPMLDLTHVQYYAGVPLHSSTGQTIGSFCLMDGFAKSADHVDVADLKAFARRAEQELWKLEPGAAVG